tara:strand:- start:45 stop:455 length:411 start_codon:yes stop_codon:yes gene_type:complete
MATVEGKKITIVGANQTRNEFGLRNSNNLPSRCSLHKEDKQGVSRCKLGLHSTTLILERGHREWWDERCFISFVSEDTTFDSHIAHERKEHSRVLQFSAQLSLDNVERLIDGLEQMREDMILTKANKERTTLEREE